MTEENVISEQNQKVKPGVMNTSLLDGTTTNKSVPAENKSAMSKIKIAALVSLGVIATGATGMYLSSKKKISNDSVLNLQGYN